MNASTLGYTLAALIVGSIAASPTFPFSKKDVTSCGADPSGVNDSSTAIQSCLNAAGSEAAIYFPPGHYKVSTGIVVGNNNVTLYSDSRASARIDFVGCGDAIKFSKGASELFNGGVAHLWIYGNGACAQTGLHLLDTSWVGIDDAQIDVGDGSERSIGIEQDGREGFHVSNTFISANNPVVIGINPNNNQLSADHVHLDNLYTAIQGSQNHWHLTLNSGVVVSNFTVDGAAPMAGGCGIIRWVTMSTPSSVSTHLRLANIRHEQMSPGCDRQIDIEQPAGWPLQELVIDNVRLEGPFPTSANAIFLSNVDSVTIRDTSYVNAASSANPANFVNANNVLWIELQNNYVYPYGGIIVTNPTLVWKDGPFRGKGCCNPPGTRTIDSGILGVSP